MDARTGGAHAASEGLTALGLALRRRPQGAPKGEGAAVPPPHRSPC
jgi:hypothetical protein